MGNWQVEPASKPQALTPQALRALRNDAVKGISRRQLIRASLGAGIGLWLLEVTAGSLGFLWPAIATGSRSSVKVGTLPEIKAKNVDLPIDRGFPAYFQEAKSFVMLVDPTRQEFVAGEDPSGDGTKLNVRALYQRCPHLGCKPNPCQKNFWFECPCHGSRYDRLGIKAAGAGFGPAPRSMDRFGIKVDESGALIVDTLKLTLGPLPIALGQPGLIPPTSPTGCI